MKPENFKHKHLYASNSKKHKKQSKKVSNKFVPLFKHKCIDIVVMNLYLKFLNKSF